MVASARDWIRRLMILWDTAIRLAVVARLLRGGYPNLWRPLRVPFKIYFPLSRPPRIVRPISAAVMPLALSSFWVRPLPTPPISLSHPNSCTPNNPPFFLNVSASLLWLLQRPSPAENPRKVRLLYIYFTNTNVFSLSWQIGKVLTSRRFRFLAC